MQTYGKFFKHGKTGFPIVDNWSIARTGLFNHIQQHVFNGGIMPGQRFGSCFGGLGLSVSLNGRWLFSLFYFGGMEQCDDQDLCGEDISAWGFHVIGSWQGG